MAIMFGLLFSLTMSAGGKWVKLTKDFDRSIPFQKIQVNINLNFHENAKIYFSKTPNDDSSDNSYYWDANGDYLFEDGRSIAWNDMELGKLLGGNLHTFPTIMFFKGADEHASLGRVKVWVDDDLVANYKKQQEEIAAQAQAEAQAKKEAAQRLERAWREHPVEMSAMQWVNNTYTHVITELAQKNEVPDENRFFTADFNRVLKACDRAGEISGDIIGWDWNHWIMAQDWDNPSVAVQQIDTTDSEHVTALIKITDGENSQLAKLKLAKENGDWKIDDFMQSDDGKAFNSEKLSAIKGIKSAGLARLLTNSSAKGYSDLMSINDLAAQFMAQSESGKNNLNVLSAYITKHGYQRGATDKNAMGRINFIIFTRNCTADQDGEIVRFGKGNSSEIIIGFESSFSIFACYNVFNKGAADYLREQLPKGGFSDMGVDGNGLYTYKKNGCFVHYSEDGNMYKFEMSYTE